MRLQVMDIHSFLKGTANRFQSNATNCVRHLSAPLKMSNV